MKTNHNIDYLLKESLSGYEKPSEELVAKVKCRLNYESVQTQKTKSKHPLRLAAAIIVICIALAATGIALGSYFGAFDRLRQLIGEQEAAFLRRVEISNEYRNVLDEFITDEGIRVEVVAVAVLSNIIDVYFTLEDMVADRLHGDINISIWVSPLFEEHISLSITSLPTRIIERTASGIVMAKNRFVYSHEVIGQELQFVLSDISFNFREGQYDMGIDLSWVEAVEPAYTIVDTPILPTRLHNIELEMDGFDVDWRHSISSIGIIDGRLHLQTVERHYPQWFMGRDRHVSFVLIGPDGMMVPNRFPQWERSAISFRFNEYGELLFEEAGLVLSFDELPDPDHPLLSVYTEEIYNIDLTRLSEYRVEASFSVHEQINLRWSTQFAVEQSVEGSALIATDLNIELECCNAILREVRITETHVMIEAEYFENISAYESPPIPNPSIVIDTIYGVVRPISIATSFGSSHVSIRNEFDENALTGYHTGFSIIRSLVRVTGTDLSRMELLDLDSVTSVEIGGHVIPMR